jgi:predicted secreted hydrolase
VVRLVATLGAVVCLAVCVSAAGAGGTPHLRFPRDHFGHPGASIEWWYFTALVRDPAGARYSVFFTLFSSNGALVPVAEVRDLATGKVVGHSERLAAGRVGASSLDTSAAGSRLQYLPASNTWLFSVSGHGLRVSLAQRPEKPYALHGDGTGVIRQSVAGVSHYYSATRMRATGTLRVGGKEVAIRGESWFDHQWGDYRDDPRAFNWEWFSCRFDDRTELMLYQFLDRKTGRPLARFANGTFDRSDGRTVAFDRFEASHGPRLLRAAGRSWPLDWQLRVPSLKLSESVRAVLPDQLVRNTVVPTFWEGVARARGTHAGFCFVELSYR